MKFKTLLLIALLLGSLNLNAFVADEKEYDSFILIGDTGQQNSGQRAVADSMMKTCLSFEKCEAALLLGDNIYPAGMEHVDDPIIDRAFRDFYEELGFPFYITLGNHDYGKLGRNWKRGSYELEYAKKNPQFILPDYYYVKEYKDMVVAFIDTSRIMWAKDMKVQGEMMERAYELSKKTNKWFVVAGHHPYLSNGGHGNAGKYDRFPLPFFISGRYVKKFLKEYVCGKAQLYFSGHDHSLQFIDGNQKDCGTYLVISGAGGSGEKLSDRNTSEFQTNKVGFVHLTTSKEKFVLKAYNENAEVTFSKIVTK